VGDEGKTTDPLALLRSKGFDIGSYTGPSAIGASGLYQVLSIDGKTPSPMIVLRDLAADDITRKVDVHVFLAGWEHRDPKDFVQLHAGWPAGRPSSQATVKSLIRRGAIHASLGSLIETADYEVENRVTIYVKPTRKVEASRDAGVGQLVLLPETNSVKSKLRSNFLAEEHKNAVEVEFEPAELENQYFLMPCTGSSCCAPLWCVGTTDEPLDANMVWATAKVQMLTGHDFYGAVKPSVGASGRSGSAGGPSAQAKTKAKPKAKSTAKRGPAKGKKNALPAELGPGSGDEHHSDADDQASEITTVIPLLVNSKSLRKGDILLVYKAKADKKKVREAQPINVGTLAKKARAKE
jgi:hypothetical protein